MKTYPRVFALPELLILACLLGLALLACDRDGSQTGVLEPDDHEGEPMGILTAVRVMTPPLLDGFADDPVWTDALLLAVPTEVAAIQSFEGYEGRRYHVGLKALYDDDFLYLLAQWDDPVLDQNRDPFYFEPATSKWMQESGRPTLEMVDSVTVEVRPAFYEDKFSLMWEASPVQGFESQACGVACHTGLSPFSNDGNKVDLKYTNNLGEVMDMWHWKFVRNGVLGTMDDQFTDSQSAASNGGRKSDEGTNSYVNNRKTIGDVTVPFYIITTASEPYYWITPDDIASGLAKEVVDVTAEGVLSLSDGTEIDPNVDTRYQRDGILNPPSVYLRVPSGDRADIDAIGEFSGGWTLEIRRSLVTNSSTDVDFDDLDRAYPFGVAVFDNAQIAHATSFGVYQLVFE